MNKVNQHFSSLDLFRAVAGYGVAICHFYYYVHDQSNYQFYSLFFVEFFFVLSGFVLYPQLVKVYKKNKNLKIFFMRRWFRTIPLYILALFCYSILFSKFDLDTLKYFFFIQHLTDNFLIDDYFSVAWSLSVEEIFYIIFPLFLILLKKKNFVEIILIFLSLIYVLKIFYISFADVDNEFFRIGTFLRLDSIAFGLIVRKYYIKINSLSLNIFSSSVIIILLNFIKDLSLFNKYEIFLFILIVQIFSINLILIFIHLDKFIKKKYLQNLFSLLSKQTYSVYLFHFFPIYFLKNSLIFLDKSFIFLIYVMSLFLISTLSYYLFEKPILTKRPKY